MKKWLLVTVFLVMMSCALVWFNRVDLLLGYVKYQSEQAFEVDSPRVLNWQNGPIETPKMVSAKDRPPNIILILADDLGFNDISTFGGGVAGGRVKTPHIDQLAADGAVFEQAYAGNATCAPSRAMIMTGRYPARTGFEFTPTPSGMGSVIPLISSTMDSGLPEINISAAVSESALPYEDMGLPSSEVTVAEILKQKGYYTAHIGKWHLGRSKGFAPLDQGFDDSLLMASALYLPENDPSVVNAKLDFDPIDQFLWARFSYAASFNNAVDDRFEPSSYLTDYWTDEAINVIQSNRNRPFFLYLAHWATHSPLQATKEDYEAVGDIKPHRLRVYAAMIRALDRSIGRITETLEKEGLADNTIIMFSSDNGGPGYIGLPDINAPFRGWKLTNFEGGIRVPMFVKWPSKIKAGTRIQTPVAHIDVMPTLAAAAKASLPEGVEIDGVNIMPLAMASQAESDNESTWTRDTLFWQSGHYRVVRYKDWKLQVSDNPKKRWLFDLALDPHEKTNLAEAQPEKVDELLALLDAHQASAREPLYPFAAELPVAVDKNLAEKFVEGDEYVMWPN